ncbi:MAG: DUF5916 domain-containing protein, partial [Acidobacteria bacterium]|nr:DUF5916 domain-containing protein [Acidobacteriota bacterium]
LHSVLVFITVLWLSCLSQDLLIGAVAQGPARKVARAVRVDGSPTVDGDLSEALWSGVPAVSEFLQRDPQEGTAATERTEVRIIYNDQSIFFGVLCEDSEAGRIIANERARDNSLGSDDTFEIILDTFHNHQDGFLFRTNPLGTKFDSWITDEGGRENSNWDERWLVAATRNEVGWTVEIEIPFNSIRMPAKDSQVWGIDFKRNIRRKNEEAVWSNYRRDFNFLQVSQAGELVGLENISSEHRLRIKPYLTGGASRAFRDGTAETDHLFDVGLEDVKYQLTPSLTLDFTANPDFAQADVDQQIVNLTRFSVFFPERREFFQENASLFDFGPGGDVPEVKLFHSRTIGLSASREPIDILAGVKLTGQIKGLDLGFINMQTDDLAGTPGSNFSVLRFRKRFLSRSNVGAMVTNRQSSLEDDSNRVFGVDGNFVFFDNLHVESFFASSQTPGLEENAWASRPIQITWQTDFLSANAEHMIIGRNFNAEMGFVPRADMNQTLLNFQVNPRPSSEWIRRFELGADLRYLSNQDEVLETREQTLRFGVVFESGDSLQFGYTKAFEFLEDPFQLRDRLPVPPGSYRSDRFQAQFFSYGGRKVSGFFQLQRENDFWDGHRTTLTLNPNIKWSQNLSFEIQYRLDDVVLPGGEFSSSVSNVGINYNFTNEWLTSTTLQYDNLEDLFNINFRLNYIYRLGDDLFVVFNQTRRSDLTDRAVIVKLTHSFDF